jgi:uncharacterized membrane protein/ribosomal protein L40E
MDNTIVPLPKVRFGDWIGEGWNMFAEQWKVWVLNSLILSLVTVVPAVGIYILMFVAAAASAGSGSAGLGVVMLALMFVGVFLIVLLSVYLVGGMYHTAFKQLRGEPISTSDLFSVGDRFPSLLGAAIVVGILVMIGAVLCIVPAFIVAGALYFTLPLVIERRLSVGDAIQASRDATRGDLFMFVLFALVVSIIAQSGTYLCYVGMLVTWPLQFTIAAIAYRDCFGMPGARSFASKPAPPHAYGAPPPSGYQPAPPQQWPGYGSAAPPSAVYQPLPTAVPPATAPQEHAPTGAVQQASTGEVICPECQAELPASARFCARCGRSLIEQ